MTLMVAGGLLAVTAGLLTGSPNGLSFLGVLVFLWGAFRVFRADVESGL